MNSLDGRIKANAAIVPAGTDGSVSVFVTDTTNVVLDIDGYFVPATDSALAFYPLTPCRVVDTRNSNGDLGGPFLAGNEERDFPVLESSCFPQGVTPAAYSFNFTAVPHPAGQRLGFLTAWPQGEAQPTVSTLNNPTGTVVANAAIVPAGTNGGIAVFPNDDTDLVIDINGYFAAPAADGLSLYTLTPCRVLDTRQVGNGDPFSGELTVNVAGSPCSVPALARGYVFNATVVPPQRLGFLTLWPDGQDQPLASTLNAIDGAITSNMAIVPTTNGSVDAFASSTTQLVLDISSYLAPLSALTITTTSLPNGATGTPYSQQLNATGGEPPYSWTVTSGNLPDGLSLSSAGLISGTPTASGVYSFTVQVSDALSSMTTANLTITVETERCRSPPPRCRTARKAFSTTRPWVSSAACLRTPGPSLPAPAPCPTV